MITTTAESRLYNGELRLYYMDNLRALAMLWGVLFHAALAYSPMSHNIWLSADLRNSEVVDIILWFTHIFRMPLFFLIAGFFCAYLVKKRGIGGMLKNRALRILLPLIIFLPFCFLAIFSGLMSAVAQVQQKSPMLEMVAFAMANPGTPSPPPSTMHLWFLYNLLFFCVFTWVLSYLNWEWLRSRLVTIHPVIFLLAFPVLLIPALCSVSAPYPAPDSFLPQLWSFGFFGIFFTVGYLMFAIDNFVERFKPYRLMLILTSLVIYVVYYLIIPKQISITPVPVIFWKKIIAATCEAYIAVWMTFACLVLGKTWLNSQNKIMRIIADSSYWIYIIHLPLLFAIQYQLMDKPWNWLTKLGVSAGVALAIGLVSYLLLVRWTPIGWMLNGRKQKEIN